MSTALEKAKTEEIDLWYDKDKLKEIRELVCSTPLTDTEFDFLVKLGRATGLNPITKEIWAIKFKSKDGRSYPATIFIGRDGYRKSAQRDAQYDYHQADAVYSNDNFMVVDGMPQHKYTLSDRGKLVGAYCVAKRKASSRPVFVYVELSEYQLEQGLWKGGNGAPAKPATMIKKVAESQCLRACFQDLLGGTYSPEEMPEREIIQVNDVEPRKPKSQILTDKLLAAKDVTLEVDYTEIDTGVCVSESEMEEIEALIAVKGFSQQRCASALEHYKVERFSQLTSVQAQDFIGILRKLEDK